MVSSDSVNPLLYARDLLEFFGEPFVGLKPSIESEAYGCVCGLGLQAKGLQVLELFVPLADDGTLEHVVFTPAFFGCVSLNSQALDGRGEHVQYFDFFTHGCI
jgi:hypothetical protein